MPVSGQPEEARPASLKPDSFWRDVLTDLHDDFDTGRFLALITVVAGVFLAAWTVMIQGKAFDAQSYGIGVGGLLTGLAAYLFGDAKR